MSGRLIVCTAVVCAVCFIALKGAVSIGVPIADLVLATATATLVLAAASAGFALRALLRSRQAHDEVVRLARSMDAAIRDLSAEVRRNAPAARQPGRSAAQTAREIILAPPVEPSGEPLRPAAPRYRAGRLGDPAS
ncbi:hypothetical protein [Mesorhizobium sp. IMUNJ 23232]|uniref:hypothetical protein n=1 Tax=Mesorhizobium sp. IMUNJ 23232 TaxID=3376064 RepID=UPI0037B695A5